MANKNKYKQVETFLIANAVGRTSQELAELVNREYGTSFTKEEMQQFKKARKIKSGARVKYSDTFPEEVAEYIKANYVGIGHKQQAENIKKKFGKEYTPQQIKSFYANNGLNSGLTGHFIPGQPSHNKGKKCKTVGNMAKTQFKKGNRPHNALPVGTEIVRTDGYHQTKIAEPDVWKLTHLLVWEENYGEIPEGMLIEFKDCNRDNVSLSNLFMVSRAEHAEMNRNNCALRSQIPELTEVGSVVARVRVKAREKAKNEKPKL